MTFLRARGHIKEQYKTNLYLSFIQLSNSQTDKNVNKKQEINIHLIELNWVGFVHNMYKENLEH